MLHELPLQQWRLRNFKSVREATIDFAPLTVLVGPNSSGKSSLIQSILSCVQAARSFMDEPRFPLNGVYLGLGDYDDLQTQGAATGGITLGGAFSLTARSAPHGDRLAARTRSRITRYELNWDVKLVGALTEGHPGSAMVGAASLAVSVDEDGGDRDSVHLAVESSLHQSPESIGHGGQIDVRGEVRFGGRERPEVVDAVVQKAGIPLQVLVRRRLSELRAEVFMRNWIRAEGESTSGVKRLIGRGRSQHQNDEIDEFERLRKTLDTLSSILASDSGDIPDGIEPSIDLAGPPALADEVAQALAAAARAFLDDPRDPRVFETLVESDDLSRLAHDRLAREQLKRFVASVLEQGSPGQMQLVEIRDRGGSLLREASRALFEYLRGDVVYLGPLRERPQVMYRVIQTEAPDDVGTAGQHTAAVLYRNQGRKIRAPHPSGGARTMKLGEAVDAWVSEFGLAARVRTRDAGRHGFELLVEVDGLARPLDPTSVGVGVSQVLPVLVRVLLADPGQLIMLEQPELHLHPQLQQKLGDFLLRASQSGRQILVETHSDHLVTRLRRRIAEADDESVGDLVRLLFVYQEGGGTTYRPVDINEFGGIDEWPPGFFDQAVEDVRQIVQAGLEKKRQRTNPDSV